MVKWIIASFEEEDFHCNRFQTPPKSPSKHVSKELEAWMFINCNIPWSRTLLEYYERIVKQLCVPRHAPLCLSPNCARNRSYAQNLTYKKIEPMLVSSPYKPYYTSSELGSMKVRGRLFHFVELQNKALGKVHPLHAYTVTFLLGAWTFVFLYFELHFC
jgi:hypothetical protein